jgi:hypothetical protein
MTAVAGIATVPNDIKQIRLSSEARGPPVAGAVGVAEQTI